MPESYQVQVVDTTGWRLHSLTGSSPPARKIGGKKERYIDAPIRGRLFQEDLLQNPFWMLVACSLVNLTNWEAARDIHAALADRYAVEEIAVLDPDDLHDLLRPLGLWRRRGKSLVGLARAWLDGPPRCAADVLKLPGCGLYASHTWAIFIEGRTDVDPTDGKLRWFLERVARGEAPSPVSRVPQAPSSAEDSIQPGVAIG